MLVPAVALLAAVACSREPAPGPARAPAGPPPWSLSLEPLASPAADTGTAPQLTTSNGGVILSWFASHDETTSLMFSERIAAGPSGTSGWTPPTTVASGSDWFVTDADVPSVLQLADGTLVANWLKSTDPAAEAYDLVLSYSKDAGKTWARPFTPHHDGTKTQHGFASFFEAPAGGVGVVWLDGRNQMLHATSPGGGSMSIWSATYDRDWKQTSDQAIDTRVCECCPTGVAVTSSGPVAAFRNLDETNLRNVHTSRFENGAWTPSQPVHDDGWRLDACPINGPAVSARGSAAVVAWYSAKDDMGKAYAAFSSDAGRTWGAPIRLDEAASLGHVDVELLDDGSAVATWMEFASERADLRVRRIEPSGTQSAAIKVSGDGRPAGTPRVARKGDELVFAWVENAASGGGRTLRTAVARLLR